MRSRLPKYQGKRIYAFLEQNIGYDEQYNITILENLWQSSTGGLQKLFKKGGSERLETQLT
jgi:hypothetical protein